METVDPDKMLQNAVSDQVLQSFLLSVPRVFRLIQQVVKWTS